MKINDELHDTIVDKLTAFIEDQKLAAEKPVFDGMVTMFEEIITSLPETKKVEVIVDKSKVRYVGPEQHYSDSLYNTGNWIKSQVKLVAVSVASKMLLHPDVYVPVSDDEEFADDPENVITDEQEKKVCPDFDPELQDLRDSVNAMTRKAAVVEFVARNFSGMEIPAEAKDLTMMKQFALTQIDAFHVPGVGEQ